MSGPTEQHEISEESPYAAHVDALLDRFSALVEHAQTIAFPPLRKGVTAPPDMTGWSKFRRIAFTISSPLLTTLRGESSYTLAKLVFFSIWLLISAYWFALANLVMEDHIFGTKLPTTPRSKSPIWIEIVGWVLLVLAIAFIPAAYWRWIEFFRDRRYPVRWRLILTLLFVAIMASFPWWGLDLEYRTQLSTGLLQHRANQSLSLCMCSS